MNTRTIITTSLILAAGLTLPGCLSYSGSWRPPLATTQPQFDKDPALQKQANQTQLAQSQPGGPVHAGSVEAAAMSSERSAPASFEEPARADADSRVRFPGQTEHSRYSAMSGLGMFGQPPRARFAHASSMDGDANVRRVTFASEGDDFNPAVSADGKKIIYASTQHRLEADIYEKNVDGSSVVQLTSDPADDIMPVYSPDGSMIAFASNRAGNWDIYVKQLPNGHVRPLTTDASDQFHPSFSPDGNHLVYCTYGERSGQWEMVIIDVDNPAVKRHIGFGLFPNWSPLGDKILYQRARERGTEFYSVWTIDLVDGEAIRPTQVAAAVNAAAITPRWSPDGQHIVFTTVVNPSADGSAPVQSDVWMQSLDGQDRVKLTEGKFANLQPVWSRDGTIFFVSNRAAAGMENIWALRPDWAAKVAQIPSNENIPGAPTETASVPTEDE